jgi:hypothetical protein
MSECIAHLVGDCQRQLWMRGGKLREALGDAVAGLADDLDVANDSVLGDLAPIERSLTQVGSVAVNALDRVNDVL